MVREISTADLLGSGVPIELREPDPRRDSIDGVVPGLIVDALSPEAVAATLAWASAERLSLVIRGSGTKMGWGAPPQPIDVVLGTRRLNRILAHSRGDLTVRVEAGAPLGAVNGALAAHGQWLALDPPFDDEATIGGLLATNDSGPHRHRFGTPRDLVIGIEVATTDGRIAKAGGQVVKNVAGYDLSKLMSGSFGSLAAIVCATFKLSPRAEMAATMRLVGLTPAVLALVVDAIMTSQIEPVAFDFHLLRRPGGRLAISCLVRFAAIAPAVDAQLGDAAARLAAAGTPADVVAGAAEQEIWQQHRTAIWKESGAIVRASWLPADVTRVVAVLDALAPDVDLEVIGRAGVGAGLIRIGGDAAVQVAAVRRLRESPVFGNVVIARGEPGVRREAGAWGAVPNAPLLASIKQTLDPHRVLGAGRGPI